MANGDHGFAGRGEMGKAAAFGKYGRCVAAAATDGRGVMLGNCMGHKLGVNTNVYEFV
jgi:hypothetical protein